MIRSVINKRKGFTLIEVIATVALLSIISIISVVSVNNVIEESKISDCNGILDNISIATKEYVSDNRYNLDVLNKYKVTDSGYYNILADVLISNNYLSSPIVNPFTNDEVEPTKIGINVWLKEDYTFERLEIYNSSNVKISCDDESTFPGGDDSSDSSDSTETDDVEPELDINGDENVVLDEGDTSGENINAQTTTTKVVEYVNKFPSGAYCAQAIDEFYTENGTTYYFTCQMSQYIYVVVNGVEYGLVEALESGIVTISEVEEAKGSEFLSKTTDLSLY